MSDARRLRFATAVAVAALRYAPDDRRAWLAVRHAVQRRLGDDAPPPLPFDADFVLARVVVAAQVDDLPLSLLVDAYHVVPPSFA